MARRKGKVPRLLSRGGGPLLVEQPAKLPKSPAFAGFFRMIYTWEEARSPTETAGEPFLSA